MSGIIKRISGQNLKQYKLLFLESYDFTGKRILPLCTNEGSGLSSSIYNLAN